MSFLMVNFLSEVLLINFILGKNDGELFKAIKSGVFKMNKSISFSG
jgi:hypothetical protein